MAVTANIVTISSQSMVAATGLIVLSHDQGNVGARAMKWTC